MKFIKPREYFSNWGEYIDAVCSTLRAAGSIPLVNVLFIVCILIPVGFVACLVGLRPEGDC